MKVQTWGGFVRSRIRLNLAIALLIGLLGFPATAAASPQGASIAAQGQAVDAAAPKYCNGLQWRGINSNTIRIWATGAAVRQIVGKSRVGALLLRVTVKDMQQRVVKQAVYGASRREGVSALVSPAQSGWIVFTKITNERGDKVFCSGSDNISH
ncbi:hypothetical protein [Prauserella cavernicola]|uniref:SH3 domain-containing protein n=1 Tax=Prauserella cavernicola TaxID=2800127 RepID=A0A934V7P3_9PSEU|nr:hypothetical protein [Prauserella cavernicola]MBK1788802.1 hypothetical protein [Prauserella cavernicola]